MLAGRGSHVRRKFYLKGQALFVTAMGTVWSVANSTFVYSVVQQVAFAGESGELQWFGPGPEAGIEGSVPGDDRQHHYHHSHHYHHRSLSYSLYHSPSLQGREMRGLRDDPGRPPDEDVFVRGTGERIEALYGMAASFAFGCSYFCLAAVCIAGISVACRCSVWCLERCGCGAGQSIYLIELSMLLQNNW